VEHAARLPRRVAGGPGESGDAPNRGQSTRLGPRGSLQRRANDVFSSAWTGTSSDPTAHHQGHFSGRDGDVHSPEPSGAGQMTLLSMSDMPFEFQKVPPTTWVYLSSLMMVALFFKFNRLWSVRNLDVLGLILYAPGLLLVLQGRGGGGDATTMAGFVWLFVVAALFLVRLLVDPTMVRRPLLETNMNAAGMSFLGLAMLAFLTANVAISAPAELDLQGPKAADQLRAGQRGADDENLLATRGPGFFFVYMFPTISTEAFISHESVQTSSASGEIIEADPVQVAAARVMAIAANLAIVVGMVLIGLRHFDNANTGVAAALMYLMLPYTVLMTGDVYHTLPAALLVWAILGYRHPLASGMLVGLAIGSSYFPIFLLPLWCGFYWQKGLWRFGGGVVLMLTLLAGLLIPIVPDFATWLAEIKRMFGVIFPLSSELKFHGFWSFSEYLDPVYRIPVLVAFLVMCGTLAVWPAQKNLGTLMSCSAAVMLGLQFWHAHDGGLYMAWYLPLMVLTIFRPNLEDRVAVAVLHEPWLPKPLVRVGLFRRAA